MKKMCGILIAAGALASVTLAQENSNGSGLFVGLQVGAGISGTEFTSTTTSLAGEQKMEFNNSDWSGNVGLKVGYYFNESHRIYLSYVYDATLQVRGVGVQNTLGNTFTNYVDAKFQSHKILVGYDYIHNLADSHNLILGGYLGYVASIGKFDIASFRASSRENMLEPNHFRETYNSIAVGVNVGYLRNLRFGGSYFGDIEAGVRFEYMNLFPMKKTIQVTTGGTNFASLQESSAEVFNAGIYLGYSYKF